MGLNSAQQKLVEDNLKLVDYVACVNFLSQLEDRRYRDDLLSEGVVGLVYAAENYNDKLNSKFSTYAYKCIKGYMQVYISKMSKIYYNEFSMDQSITKANCDSDSRIEVKDLVEDKSLYSTDMIQYLILAKNLKPLYYKAFILYINGYNYAEIGKELKLSRERIRVMIDLAINYLRDPDNKKYFSCIKKEIKDKYKEN